MTSTSCKIAGITRYASLMACVLACALTLVAFAPTSAYADVRNNDIVCGDTVEARGLSTALCPSIEANHAILVDDTGKIYFERSAHDPVKVASITKVMTAIVALEYDPQLLMTVTVTEDAANIGESSALLLAGDAMTMKDALTAMMVASGNDAAESVATAVGASMLADEGMENPSDEQSVQRFVQAMNDKAGAMGLENTYFTNPHGLDDEAFAGDLHSTAYDVYQQVAYAMKIPAFREMVGHSFVTVSVNRDGGNIPLELTSTDEMLEMYEGTVGVKTGFTAQAGGCFAGANDHDGREYYAIVLDSVDEYERFVDTMTLWDWCYSHWVDYPLVHSDVNFEIATDDMQGAYPLVAYVGHADWIDHHVAATFADPQQTVHVFDLDGNISQEAEFKQAYGNVRPGDELGTVVFKQHNNVIAEVPLVAAEDASAPDPFTGIGIWWQRLTGNNTVADSYLVSTTPAMIDKTQTIAA